MFPGPALSQGRIVDRFEEELAEYLKVPQVNIVAVSTGTAALHLVFHYLKTVRKFTGPIGLPATTFIATANAVKYAGLNVDILDVDPDHWGVPDKAAPQLQVDLYGVRSGHHALVEDACEALGTDNVPWAEYATFSFFASKIITTGGEGGAVYCRNKKDADYIRLLRQQGKDFSMEKHAFFGFNYRMTEMQARYGIKELKQLPERVQRCRLINSQYRKQLPSFKFQEDPSGGSNCWQTALLIDNRDQVIQALLEHKIESKKVFCSLAEYRWLWDSDKRPETPVADWLAQHGLCLPSHHSLTDTQVEQVSKIVNEFGKPVEYNS